MNKEIINLIKLLYDNLDDIRNELEMIYDSESEILSDISDEQNTVKYEEQETVCDCLGDAVISIDAAMESINDLM